MLFSLKTYIRRTFPFGKYDLGYDILGLIAKKEGLVEYQITNHLAQGTRRKVNNTINNFLIPYEFVYEKRPAKSRRNVRNAFGKGKEIRPKKYYLTFKGFLVSLTKVGLKNNHITKKYLEFFPENQKDNVLEYLKNNILLYVFYNDWVGLELNNVKDLVFHIDDTGFHWNKIDLGKGIRQKIREIENNQSQLSEKLFNENEDLFNLIEYWAEALELITKYQENEKILKELEKRTFEYKVKESGFYEKFGINRDTKL